MLSPQNFANARRFPVVPSGFIIILSLTVASDNPVNLLSHVENNAYPSTRKVDHRKCGPSMRPSKFRLVFLRRSAGKEMFVKIVLVRTAAFLTVLLTTLLMEVS